jgi:catechol 2,3-dioxygenase
MTKPDVIRIAQAIFTVSDLAASREFYVDLLGMNVLHEEGNALYLRGVEDREWTLKLEQSRGPQDPVRVRQLGYRVRDEQSLDALIALAAEQKLPWRWEEELDRPRMLRLQDPFGIPLSFYHEVGTHPWMLQEFHRHRGPGLQRVDHVNVMVPDVKATMDWYLSQLDFRLSEYTVDDQDAYWAAWIQRRGGVHDLALTNGPGPRLHHWAYWMPDINSIIRTCDILAGARQPERIERGPGRHGISNAFFLYIRDPDGHRIELYTSDYITVDPDFQPIRWMRDDPRRQTLWGAKTPLSWFEEASVMEAFEGGLQAHEAGALTGIPVHVI